MRSLLCLAVCLSFCPPLPAQEVQSPDGALTARLLLVDGRLSYEVSHRNRPVIVDAPLGLNTSIGSFSEGLAALGDTVVEIDERYTLPHGKVREVQHRARELTARFANPQGDELAVILRVADRDVGLAYRISAKDKRRIVVKSERTGFRLPSGATAFVTPQVPWGGGFMATKPSYEEGYLLDVPVGTASPSGLGFTFPALFKLPTQGWVLVSETGVTSQYAGTRLGEPTADGLYPIAFPESAENAGIGEATVSATLPLTTPWRTLTIGDTLAPIVESTVATDLVRPLYAPSMDYAGGRAAWSWLLWQDPSMNEEDQRTFISLAATMRFEYILIDALWDENIGRDRMARLVAEARDKGVKVLLWYNSNGAWNDAPQTPRNRLDRAPARRNEMEWLRSIGVAGMKVDFFGGDKQVTMKLYEDILTDANAYGLVLNFHGATLPRGWERLYPNFMTSEAVTASENLIFSQAFADIEAHNSTVFPFVRNPVSPMDYGPVLLNRRFSRDQQGGNIRRTTDAFQLATAVLYFSPLQHFGLTPENLREQPAFALDFLREVPAVWDEVRYVTGYPGKEVVLARRHRDRWYVAATNGEKVVKELTVSLPFLAGRTCTLIHDQPDRTAVESEVTVGPAGELSLRLEPEGGAVLVSGPGRE